MASSPPDVLAFVLGLPVAFVLVWFLARAVGGRWLDDPGGAEPPGPWQPGLEPPPPRDAPPGSDARAGRAESPLHDGGLDRPEGTG